MALLTNRISMVTEPLAIARVIAAKYQAQPLMS
jgi:hypothetical protein